MDSEVLERYARHLILREFGGSGQQRLSASKILMIGAGGLGTAALPYLAAAGVGTIGVVDGDIIGLSNLQRQVIYKNDEVGTLKVKSVEAFLLGLNPNIKVFIYPEMISHKNANILRDYDLVLDGTDNIESRYLINSLCIKSQKPLITAAISQWDGQISIFDPKNGTPCYECVFPKSESQRVGRDCASEGVFGPLAGILGVMMAGETIKYIIKAGKALVNEMIIYEILWGELKRFQLKARSTCTVCKK